MHRSRIGLVLLDFPDRDYDAASTFWSDIQGVTPEVGGPYAKIGTIGSVHLETQRLGAGTPARVHLDIETDDVAAEVARVCALGAELVEERDDYAILNDPGGLVFCVVPVQTGEAFDRDALTWP